MKKELTLFILLTLAFPFVTILLYAGHGELHLNRDVFTVFAFTAWQAFLSALGSMIFGVLSASGLLYLHTSRAHQRFHLLQVLMLLPNAIPVLMLILSCLKLFPETRGLAGIVWIHVLLNSGLVALAFFRLVSGKMSGMSELAWIEGASRRNFIFKAVIPYLGGDLSLIFLSIFALCFTSFGVPLIVGGSHATTVEVLIYEQLRLSNSFGSAWGLAVLQMLFIFALSSFFRFQETRLAPREFVAPLLSSKACVTLALLPPLIVVFGLLDGFREGFRHLRGLTDLLQLLPELLAGSMLVGFGVGLFTLMFLITLVYIGPDGWLRMVLLGYVAPSSVLTGFALLILFHGTGALSLLKISIGVTLVSIPTFYRLQWDAVITSMQGQVDVARTLGADELLIFDRILLPQVWQPACFLSGIAAFWAWGDFSISTVIAERSLTVALLVEQLMQSYRFDVATVLVWLLLFGGGVTFLIFWGLGHVISEES